MKEAWNKGLTKYNSSGLARIAELRRKNNNFATWQAVHPVHYALFKYSNDLAEFYGNMLGDGCIEQLPRTEKLSVAFNAKEKDHIKRIKKIIEKIFKKVPSERKLKGKSCIQIYIYQKYISRRLKFPIGIKKYHELKIPHWIKKDQRFLIRCLKGLFETDGSWKIDPKYNTNVINYVSIHNGLLDDICNELCKLGFYARRTTKRVTLNRRAETEKFAKLIKFRQY